MKLGILTTDRANELPYNFRIITLKIEQGIQEYRSVAFLDVLRRCTECYRTTCFDAKQIWSSIFHTGRENK